MTLTNTAVVDATPIEKLTHHVARRRQRMHRLTAGVSLFVAPVALLGSELAYRGSNDPAQLVTDAVQHHGAIVASIALILVSSAFLVPAAFAVLHLARDRGRRIAEAGFVLSVLGALGHAAYAGFTAVQLSTAQGDRAQMIDLLERVNHSTALAPIAVCIMAFAVGFLCIVISAWRAGLVPIAAPLLALVAFVIEAANVHSVAGGAIKEALGIVALGWIGARVLHMSDEAWSSDESRQDARTSSTQHGVTGA